MGYEKIVAFLLKRKAKHFKNQMGENALYKAVVGHNKTRFSDKEQKNKYEKTINKLFQYLSPVNITPIQSKHLVYHIIDTEKPRIFKLAINEGIKQNLDVLKYLLKRLSQTEDLPEQKDFITMLKVLLKSGVKPKFLLHTASNLKIAKLLIAAGDKPTNFYDNKKFISKEVRNFIYPPPPPKKKTPPKKKSPTPIEKLRERRKRLEKMMGR